MSREECWSNAISIKLYYSTYSTYLNENAKKKKKETKDREILERFKRI